MKLTVVVVCLSVAVMTVLIYQALRQEVDLRRQKTLLVDNSAEVKRKEMAIVEAKKTIQQLKASLGTINEDIEGLKKKKEENDKAAQEFEQADQEEAKKKAEQDIQGLKQQILDRDKAICAFVDTTKEEARWGLRDYQRPEKNTINGLISGGNYLSKIIQSKARLFTRNIRDPGAGFEYVVFANKEEKSAIPLGSTVLIETSLDSEEGRKKFISCKVTSTDGSKLHTEATVYGLVTVQAWRFSEGPSHFNLRRADGNAPLVSDSDVAAAAAAASWDYISQLNTTEQNPIRCYYATAR
ncbi:hypothetical protein F2P81_001936 [Scophthalmus maximus]|uniref:Uncharacterized protein n=1 Tax=Scophthalmus maximus TaxID=52904 RepID=A0A6A4TFK6_SCOMX|nr:hypothetical protein F2P81_001936 [Scophthalmus maximus]